MKRLIVVALVAIFAPSFSFADTIKDSIDRAIDATGKRVNPVGFDDGRIRGFDGVKHPGIANPRPLVDGPFVISQVLVWSSTYWDFSATRRCNEQVPECYEKNSRFRPFVERGDWGGMWRLGAQDSLIQLGLAGGTKYAFRKNRHWALRNLWVVIPASLTLAHIKGAISNERIIP